MAYHDVPYMVYEVFVNAVASKYLKEEKLIIPSLVESHNPAGIHVVNLTLKQIMILIFTDMIMDMLGIPKVRKIITEEGSNKQNSIKNAITNAFTRSVLN